MPLAQVPHPLKLQSAVALVSFIPVFRATPKMFTRSVAYLGIKNIAGGLEKSLVRKLVSYSNELISTVSPALVSDTSKFWAAVYAARTMMNDLEEAAARRVIEDLSNLLTKKRKYVRS